MSVLYITEENFESEVFGSVLPVLVDFWADWCAPCRRFSSVIHSIVPEVGGKVKVGTLNIDEFPELAQRFNVSTIPTLILFKNGEVIDRWVGAMSKQELLDKLNDKL